MAMLAYFIGVNLVQIASNRRIESGFRPVARNFGLPEPGSLILGHTIFQGWQVFAETWK